MSGELIVVSCGLGSDDLTQCHYDAVHNAEVLAGGKRLLAWFPEFDGEKIEIGAHASETVLRLAEIAKEKCVVVLASGDALFFGVARLFLEHMPPERLAVLPNITAVQAAMARIHLPWQSARFFSVHGRSARLPWRVVMRAESAVIYCDSIRTPAVVAAGLIRNHPAVAERLAVVAAKLGADDERVCRGTLAELADSDVSGMSMLILMPLGSEADEMLPELSLGLDDDVYEHEGGLITHPEIRAVVLSKLRLRAGVMWDLGAGSGSVSVEAAGLCERLDVYAVERKPERCEQIRLNAEKEGCLNYHLIQGEVLASLVNMPAPNRVFIGGGGAEINLIVTQAYEALMPSGILVATAILEETRAKMLSVMPDVAREVFEISVRNSVPLGKNTIMKPQNPITIFVFRKEK